MNHTTAVQASRDTISYTIQPLATGERVCPSYQHTHCQSCHLIGWGILCGPVKWRADVTVCKRHSLLQMSLTCKESLNIFWIFTRPSVILPQKDKKFWEELIAYFPLIQHGPHRKWNNNGDTQRQRGDLIIYTRSCCLATMGGGYIFFDTTRATLKMTLPTILLLLCVFVTTITFLPSCCLATIGGHTDSNMIS
jgi:hypothetical protein